MPGGQGWPGGQGCTELHGQLHGGAHRLLEESLTPPAGSVLLRVSETVPAFNT